MGLSRVGITDVQKVIRIGTGGHEEELFYASLRCFVDLGPEQKGAHMSRFEEVIEQAIDDVVLSEALRIELLAAHIAERVRERQHAHRAEVAIEARHPEHKTAPSSGLRTQAIYTMFGSAVASERGTRRLVGVQAQGVTACPCAQEMLTARARERLAGEGFTDHEIERVFEHVPVATHNQRGFGTLWIGCPEGSDAVIEASAMLRIVESSMSSEIFELMKREDEAEVVEAAHRQPRFVEDCVREMIRGAATEFGALGEDAFLMARQENLETIHQHNVVAEHYGLIGEIQRELVGNDSSAPNVSMREWLEGPGTAHR